MKIDVEYLKKFMMEILAVPGCGGDTEEAMARIQKEFDAFGIKTTRTRKGALIGELKGRCDSQYRMVSAHIDTLGAMVKEIKPTGRLRLASIGGYSWSAFEGENVTIKTMQGARYTGVVLPDKASIHIYSEEVSSMPRSESTMEVRLDEDVHSKEDTEKLGIRVGDFVFYDPRPTITSNDYVKARFLDDKACVAVLFGAIKHFRDTDTLPDFTTLFYISNYEEIGHGISVIPEKVSELLALDIGTVGTGHSSDERCVTIVAKDSRTPYDFEFRKRLVELAEKHQIPYKVDVHHRYGSDASIAVLQGFEVNFACIGMGVDATHHYERTHMDGISNNLKLLIKYLAE